MSVMITINKTPRESDRHNSHWCVPYATAVVTGRDYDEVYDVFNDTLERRGLVKGVKTSETPLVPEKYGVDLNKRYSVNGYAYRVEKNNNANIINVHGYDGVHNIRNINKVVAALHNTKDYIKGKFVAGDWYFKDDALWMKANHGHFMSSASSPFNMTLYKRWMTTPEADFKTRYYFVIISGHMMVYDYEKDLIIDNHNKEWVTPNDHVHRLKKVKELMPVIYTDDFVPAEPKPRPTGVSEKARLKKVYYNRVRRLCKKHGIEIEMVGEPKNWTKVKFVRVDDDGFCKTTYLKAVMTPKTNEVNWSPDWEVAYESLKKSLEK